MTLVFLAILVAVIGIFFMCDCDFFLYFAQYNEINSFSNQVIWITGASGGIGASLAKKLTSSGAQVIISARRADQLEEVAEDCAKVGLRPYVLALDVTNDEEQAKAYDEVKSKFGRLDRLVLNAGRSQRAFALETDISNTRGLLELNVLSYVFLTKLVLPDMIKNGGGQHGYYDALRGEVSQHNISISLACPGPVNSEISKNSVRGPSTQMESLEKKMETSRCTDLIAKGMFFKVDEMWISDQPFLAMTYLAVYAPWITRQVIKNVVGPSRMKVLSSGGNAYDYKKMFGFGLK